MGICETKNNNTQKPVGNKNINANTNTNTNVNNTNNARQAQTPLPLNYMRNTGEENTSDNNFINQVNTNKITKDEENSVKKQLSRMLGNKDQESNSFIDNQDRGSSNYNNRKISFSSSVQNEDSIGYNQTRNTLGD